jgi:hypothetical protein
MRYMMIISLNSFVWRSLCDSRIGFYFLLLTLLADLLWIFAVLHKNGFWRQNLRDLGVAVSKKLLNFVFLCLLKIMFFLYYTVCLN